MARVKRSVNSKKGRRKVLAQAKGYTGARSRHLRTANEQVMHSGKYAFRDRRARKGEMRKLWIVRINAACREHDMSYSQFIAGLKAAEVEVDRKMLADLAVREPAVFSQLVDTARGALAAQSVEGALGAQHRDVRRLRELLRDRTERRAQQRVVIDGPRAVDGAFDRGVAVEHVYVGEEATQAAAEVVERAMGIGTPVTMLARGVSDRISDLRTSPGIFALSAISDTSQAMLDEGDLWLVLPSLNDPGNLGTIVRSAAAAGASGICLGAGSVDVYNPKVVRASAGAVFGVPVVEGDPIVMLERLGARGVMRIAAVVPDRGNDSSHAPRTPHGTTLDELDPKILRGPVAWVLGHETRGLDPCPSDRAVTVPIAADTESLNVAMAATVLLFETARQRRTGIVHTPRGEDDL